MLKQRPEVFSGKLRLADTAELNPRFNIDARTALVAARLAARISDRTAQQSG